MLDHEQISAALAKILGDALPGVPVHERSFTPPSLPLPSVHARVRCSECGAGLNDFADLVADCESSGGSPHRLQLVELSRLNGVVVESIEILSEGMRVSVSWHP